MRQCSSANGIPVNRKQSNMHGDIIRVTPMYASAGFVMNATRLNAGISSIHLLLVSSI